MSFYSFAVLFLITVSMVHAGEQVCPGYGYMPITENCESTCSRENDECPSGTKCCFRMEQPCGLQCLVPKDDEPKAGTCPSPSSKVDNPYWGMCDGHFCDVDSDCKDEDKCCPNLCGSPVCVPSQ